MASTVPGGWRPHMVSTGTKKLWICSGPVSQDEHPSQLLRGRVAALGRDASTQCLRVTFQFRPGPDCSALPARSSIVVTVTQPRSPSSLMWRNNTWGMTPRRFHPPSSFLIFCSVLCCSFAYCFTTRSMFSSSVSSDFRNSP